MNRYKRRMGRVMITLAGLVLLSGAWGYSSEPTSSLRTISYNIMVCDGYPAEDPRRSREEREGIAIAIAMELSTYQPDIVSFQESPPETMVEMIAEEMGMQYVYFTNRFSGAVLTRYEIVESENTPLLQGECPEDLFTRHWGRALLDTGTEEIAFYSVHLMPGHDQTAIRVREITEMLAVMNEDMTKGRSILLQGDFNLTPDDPEYEMLFDAGLQDAVVAGDPTQYTLKNFTPTKRVDYIWSYGPIAKQLREYQVLAEGAFVGNPEEPNRFALSDHRPVMALFSNGPPNSAQYVANTGVPAMMIPGQTATVSITMKNTGTDTWSATNGHSLGTTSANNFWVPESNRIPLPKTVVPWQSVTFLFDITAPPTNGTYAFQWQMVDDTGENLGWFGDYAANVAVTVGVAAQTTTVWNPSGSTLWTDDANWTGGVVPLEPYQNLNVTFDFEGAPECVLDTIANVAVMLVGDNGTTNGAFLRLVSGADLVCGFLPEGGTQWTTIGFNRPATVTVEAGAVFEAAANLRIGYSGIGDSRLNIDGGLVTVNDTIMLGNVANTSHGFITINGEGRLDTSGLTFNNTNCVVDIRKGSVVLPGDQMSAVNGYMATGNLIAYEGGGQVVADYNLSHSGFTTVSATASGYVVWAVEHGIGASNDDDDGDLRGNLYEYVMRGNPTNAQDRGLDPFLLVQTGELIYAHIHRNDDPDLVYSLEVTTNLVTGIWTDAIYTVSGAIFSFGGYDLMLNQLQADDEPAYIRLKVDVP